MCIGIPMQVIEMRESHALCEADGKQELIDMLLVGDQPKGTWILNFLGAAREVMSNEFAEQTRQALKALDNVINGETDDCQQFDHLFPDLINQEPKLPEHLKALVPPNTIKQ
ncbi:HypC/HybG/HupF family hydrogenase formation chaperone [Cocleimonas flava]|uniref:Hydrogenase expression/formation protein HypC n=1 Tax=Cocleimonas flava TaxID=634765 RepID=A0A4R1F2K0_9GAMM|nr:HypC/HybG/HupF family hydrogenase formation chaperone [Cocleimonas flava]TCJ88387.1 hydrogenase expression/formation protein HypC [Cocleimonas flava]